MIFSSLVFLFIFLPITFLLYVIVYNTTFRNIMLILASLVFYAYGEPVAVFIMIISIIVNYLLGLMCSKDKYKKIGLLLGVLLNISLLIVFKYLAFLVNNFNSITSIHIPVPSISLPIGISFFTFQGLSYVIDVYREPAMVQKKLLPVFLYISFFPQLIAGPIVKYHDIMDQLDNRRLNIDCISQGIYRFIIGLGKKVLIANQVGYIADQVFNSSISNIGFVSAWIGAICYMLQIFFDFSGYSDMAIGLGCIFGFDFKENFNYPYSAASMKDFWRRWHISLSTWFKEYVYIPLGGNRCGKLRTSFNKMIVFFLTGFWHGANFTFIVWGLWHGLLLLLEDFSIIPTKNKLFKYIGHIYVILMAMLSFVIFRADTVGYGFKLIGKMFGIGSGSSATTVTIISTLSAMRVIALVLAVIFCTPVIKKIETRLASTRSYEVFEVIKHFVSLLIFALCVLMLISNTYNPFIYFRF